MGMCPGDTTEWDDIQRKFGNLPPLQREIPQREQHQALVAAAEQIDALAHCDLKELDKLEDDVEEDVLARYRRQRLAELKAKQSAAKFGEVLRVVRTNFVAEVSEGSKEGQWVLVMLYVDAHASCHRLEGPWAEAARRFPAVKFMRGVANEVVPDFPDASTPAVLVYRDNDCHKQIIGISEWGGDRCSADCVEWVLSTLGVVETELEEDPRLKTAAPVWERAAPRQRGRGGADSDEESDDEDGRHDRCYISSLIGRNMLGRDS